MKSAPYKNNRRGIASRLIFAIILCSSVITLVSTAIQLYLDYHHDVETIHTQIDTIRDSHLKAVKHSVWVRDDKLIRIQLEGLLKYRDLEYIAIRTPENKHWSAGEATSWKTVSREIPLYFEYDNENLLIGTLSVVGSVDKVYNRLVKKGALILFSNAIKTFIVALFAFGVFQYLVTRHLVKLSDHAEKLDINSPMVPCQLDRKARTKEEKPDELQQVVDALNNMEKSLRADIDKRVTIENSLRSSEQRLRTVYEAADNVSFVTTVLGSANNLIESLSPGAERIFGYSSDEVVGQPVSLLHPPEHIDNFPQTVKRWRNEHEEVSGETTLVRKSGERFPALFSVHPLLDVEGELTGTLEVAFDITPLKDAEAEKEIMAAQLRQAYKMEAIGTLAGGIAHDFNNILSAILGYAELAKDDIPDWDSVETQIDGVLHAGNRAKDLVKHILSFSRKTGEDRVFTQMHVIVEEAVKLLRASIPSSIEIRHHIDPNCGSVLAEPTQLHQVILNLCTNAAHAMHENGGTMEMTLDTVILPRSAIPQNEPINAGPCIRFSVTDSGPGIDPSIIDRIFDPYFTTKDPGEGTGMGLAVVAGIVKSHGGLITFNSEIGQGATFTVYLPQIESVTHMENQEQESVRGGDERILVVDDETAITNLSKKFLEQMGYHVTASTDSLAAFELFRSDPDAFDLVISDQTMPGMSGDQLSRQMMRIRPSIPIIISTGYSSKMDREKSESLGVKALILKPIRKTVLLKTVRQILDGFIGGVNPHDQENKGKNN